MNTFYEYMYSHIYVFELEFACLIRMKIFKQNYFHKNEKTLKIFALLYQNEK